MAKRFTEIVEHCRYCPGQNNCPLSYKFNSKEIAKKTPMLKSKFPDDCPLPDACAIDPAGLERAVKIMSTTQFYSDRERAAKAIILAYLGGEDDE